MGKLVLKSYRLGSDLFDRYNKEVKPSGLFRNESHFVEFAIQFTLAHLRTPVLVEYLKRKIGRG